MDDSAAGPPGSARRIEARRLLPATPEEIFAVLREPAGHVAIDSSGMLQSAEGPPVNAVGDRFDVDMDREALGDRPMGRYRVTVIITRYAPAAEIAWTIDGTIQPPIGHEYGYRLEPAEDGTLVTSYCDWSKINPRYEQAGIFPLLSDQALRATLGILDRTVRNRAAG